MVIPSSQSLCDMYTPLPNFLSWAFMCLYAEPYFGWAGGGPAVSIQQLHKESSCSLSGAFSFISLRRQDWRGAACWYKIPAVARVLSESPIMWDLRENVTLSWQLFLFIHLFVFEGRDVQDKEDGEENCKTWRQYGGKCVRFAFQTF